MIKYLKISLVAILVYDLVAYVTNILASREASRLAELANKENPPVVDQATQTLAPNTYSTHDFETKQLPSLGITRGIVGLFTLIGLNIDEK